MAEETQKVDPIRQVATQSFFGAVVLAAGLAVTYVMISHPWQSPLFLWMSIGTGVLAVASVCCYARPSGLPAAISVGFISVTLALITPFAVLAAIRGQGYDTPPWFTLSVVLLVVGCATPWIVRRINAAYRGRLLEDDG